MICQNNNFIAYTMPAVCKEHRNQLTLNLRDHRLKATPARLRLLDIFKHAAKPVSINKLVAMVEKNGIDQSTVYRNIKSLLAKGFIKKIGLPGRQAYYELADNFAERDHHHYLICRFCHKTVEMATCRVTEPKLKELRRLGFAKIEDHALELLGICQQCAKK